MTTAAWVCLLSPLAGALTITLLGNAISRRLAGVISTTSTAVAFVAAVVTFVDLVGEPGEDRSQLSVAWSWLGGDFGADLSILVDPLSVFMMLVVSGVGSLIVGYSIGYMDGDDEERRYFAYMALFVFSMLLLVQGGNLLMLLCGWGLVGLSSYLLIGFWHERPEAVAAAKKAFVMNAFGDATMALGLFLLIVHTGTLGFGSLEEVGGASGWVVNLVALGLLGGAVAKSAQLPLQTWLPDAMEGPTPVSALIHAATMVTAGVYLIVRCHAVFEHAGTIADLAAGLGAATLLLAGLIALVQVDIKRVIAYSTMSQIGYMFLGVGLGAYANGMFHLMTHAFFKALLFLAAGVVIHALAAEQDIRKMGGLRGLMPRTWLAMLIGGLALSGIPPFAGFFSKDSILASALDAGPYGVVLWVVGLAGAFLTGLYTFRMIFLVFGGERSPYVQEHFHPHGGREGPLSMMLPVGVLAVLSVVGGWIQFGGVWFPITHFLEPVAEPLAEATVNQELVTSAIAAVLGLAGIGLAWLMYSRRSLAVPGARPWRTLLERKFYFDEAYHLAFYRPAAALSVALGRFIERPLILGGTVGGVGSGARGVSRLTTRLQTGLLRTYALLIAASAAVLAVVFVSVR